VKDLFQPPTPDLWWSYYGAAWAIFGLAIAAVWFIVAILIAVWVYRDAEKRGESGVLWLIIVLDVTSQKRHKKHHKTENYPENTEQRI
jgi:hypothetical protein